MLGSATGKVVWSITGAAVLALGLLFVVAAATPAEAAFSGQNGRIAFVSDRVTANNPEGDNEIFTIDADGTNLAQLTKNDVSDSQPTWSPSGTKIAFTSIRNDNMDVYVMSPVDRDSDGSADGQKRLTRQPGDDLSPAWSPDGKKIAFQSNRIGNYEIYRMKAKPEGRRNRPLNVTKNERNDVQPAWSPDGKRIAYSGTRVITSGDTTTFQPDLFTIPASGGVRFGVTDDASFDLAPSYSPDGSWIAYQAINGSGASEVRLAPATGNGMVIVDSGQAPAFSPDGSKIIYESRDGTDGVALFTVTFAADTGGIPNLGGSTKVTGTESGGAPDWQPVGG